MSETVEERFWDAVNYVKSLPDPRAKLVAAQAALVGDMREALVDRTDELHRVREEHDRMLAGMRAAAASLYAAQQSVAAAIPADPSATMARMQGGWENLMAYAHGDPDYLTNGGLSTYHTDARPERKGRKKKEVA